MFVLTLLADSIRIPPPLLSQPTLTSIQTEIEKRYPNKIIIDVGLIICPYGPPLEVGDGVLVPGDGGAHHQVLFQCVVFRPFVEEVLIGTVSECNEEGLSVNVGGFFDQVFIPAYWMLNPSRYDVDAGVWIWTPSYDDNDEEEKEDTVNIKQENGNCNMNGEHHVEEIDELQATEENRFEIEIGAEIRFKVKSVNFTRITTTMKGVQATTTTTTSSSSGYGYQGAPPPASVSATEDNNNGNSEIATDVEVRRRSSSADLSDSANHPAPMQIVGSICEDGLGLTSWWTSAGEGEDKDEEDQEKNDIREEDDHIEDDGDP